MINRINSHIFGIIYLSIITSTISIYANILTVREEYDAQQKLIQLERSTDEEDYVLAKCILESFQRDCKKTDFYKNYSRKINELSRKIKKESKKIKFDDKIEYIYIPPRPETKIWQEYTARAERVISEEKDKIGITILRVIFEDSDSENPLIQCKNENDLYAHIYNRGGYSPADTVQSGEPVFIGSNFWRQHKADSNDKNLFITANIAIEGIYHYPIELKMTVQRDKVIPYGEIIVRSVPKKFCGNLKVNVVTEENCKINSGSATLKRFGFAQGKTFPLDDKNSCIFNFIGPGNYNVELARHEIFESQLYNASIDVGQTSEITIKANRRRVVAFEWRSRRSNEPNVWQSGMHTFRINDPWQSINDSFVMHYPAFSFRDGRDKTCTIIAYNGRLKRVDSNVPFAEIGFPSDFEERQNKQFVQPMAPLSVKEGDVFAWRNHWSDPQNGFLEMLIRIKTISLADIPEECNKLSNIKTDLEGEPPKE
ncbi:MAG: hypothetical protein ABFD79_02230 [Phycisphaerales bacterium]